MHLPSGLFDLWRQTRVAVRPFTAAGHELLTVALGRGLAARLTYELARRGQRPVPFEQMRRFADPHISTREVAGACGASDVISGQVIPYGSDGHFRLGLRLLDGATGAKIAELPSVFGHPTCLDTLFECEFPRIVSEIERVLRRHASRARVLGQIASPLIVLEHASRVVSELDIELFDFAEADLGAVTHVAPTLADAWAWLARAKILRLGQGWLRGRTRAEVIAEIEFAIDRALSITPRHTLALLCKGHLVGYVRGDPESGLALIRSAIATNPRIALGWTLMAGALAYLGCSEDAVAATERARLLLPVGSVASYHHCQYRALAHYAGGDYRAAILWSCVSNDRNPEFTANYKLQAAAYAALGDLEMARRAASELRRREPMFALLGEAASPFASGATDRAYRQHLRAAGVFDPSV